MHQNLLLPISLVIFSAHLILSEEFVCPRSRGYYPHPTECKKYYSCRKRISTLKECPERMLFDVNKGNCYINSAVDCGGRKTPEVTIVTISEIPETATEVNWNTKLHTRTATDELPTRGMPSSISSVKFSTSTHEVKTNEVDIITHNITIIPDVESGTSEHVLDDSTYIVSHTSSIKTDTEEESFSTSLELVSHVLDYKTTETNSASTNEINDEGVTDNSELDDVIIASTVREENGTIYGDSTAITEKLHPSSSTIGTSQTSRIVIDDSTTSVSFSPNLHTDTTDNVSENKTSENGDSSTEETTTERSDNEPESSVSYLQSVSTSITTGSDFTTNEGDEESPSSNRPIVTTFKPEEITTSEKDQINTTVSDDKDFTHEEFHSIVTDTYNSRSTSPNEPESTTTELLSTTAAEAELSSTVSTTTKRTDNEPESSVSNLQSVSTSITTGSDLTTNEGDEESPSSNRPLLTTFKPEEITTSDRDQINTTVSDDKDFTQEEFHSIVTDTYDSRSTSPNEPESTTTELLSTTAAEAELSSTVSNKETTDSLSDSTYVSKSNDGTTISSSGISSNVVTTEQIIKFTTDDVYPDDYYIDEINCPTAYGRYPHPTDKHKFIHCQEWFPHIMVCPANLIFDKKLEICVWSSRR